MPTTQTLAMYLLGLVRYTLVHVLGLNLPLLFYGLLTYLQPTDLLLFEYVVPLLRSLLIVMVVQPACLNLCPRLWGGESRWLGTHRPIVLAKARTREGIGELQIRFLMFFVVLNHSCFKWFLRDS
jgi:hypothetical protein